MDFISSMTPSKKIKKAPNKIGFRFSAYRSSNLLIFPKWKINNDTKKPINIYIPIYYLIKLFYIFLFIYIYIHKNHE